MYNISPRTAPCCRFNYPHHVASYWAMYTVARHYDRMHTRMPWQVTSSLLAAITNRTHSFVSNLGKRSRPVLALTPSTSPLKWYLERAAKTVLKVILRTPPLASGWSQQRPCGVLSVCTGHLQTCVVVSGGVAGYRRHGRHGLSRDFARHQGGWSD